MIHKFVIELTDDVKDYQHDIERLEREYGIEPIEEHDKQITAEVIDELLNQVRKEEKWLYKVIGSNQNINIAFGGIYAKAERRKNK